MLGSYIGVGVSPPLKGYLGHWDLGFRVWGLGCGI